MEKKKDMQSISVTDKWRGGVNDQVRLNSATKCPSLDVVQRRKEELTVMFITYLANTELR